MATSKPFLEPSSALWPRPVLGLLLGSAIVLPQIYQPSLDLIYTKLLLSPFNKSSIFETIWTVLIYAIIEASYTYKYARNTKLRLANLKDGGRDTPRLIPKLRRPSKRIREGIIYITPLLMMDLTMIKKFGGVPVADMALSGNYAPTTVSMRGNFLAPTLHNFTPSPPFQTQRALPPLPLTSRQLFLQLASSIFIYNAVFFFFHLALHKLSLLSKSTASTTSTAR